MSVPTEDSSRESDSELLIAIAAGNRRAFEELYLALGLNRLPDEQRLALELACHMGHSVMEIAEITGAPIGTVKARMFHARQKLRQYLPTMNSYREPRFVCMAEEPPALDGVRDGDRDHRLP
jgi:DNA-directed RNA polymerase specialized sigma24 family protein